MGQPQLVHVFGLRSFGDAPGVHVVVNEAGHHVHALGVELARGAIWAVVFVDGHTRHRDADDVFDAVIFDDDVDGTDGHTAIPINERSSTDNQSVERSLAFIWPPIGSRLDHILRLKGRDRNKKKSETG